MSCAYAVKGANDVVSGEEEDIGCQMESCIEKSVETEHPAKAHEKPNARREPTQGSDRESRKQKIESPVASEMGNVVDRIGIKRKRSVAIEMKQIEKWEQA